MQPLISVIIPVYNVDKYLEECLDSVIKQTYKNLEIILIDDGSTDSSGEVCEKFAEKDRRVIVLHKENGGLSDARNAGLNIAKGEYLVFVDSDDMMTADGIEYLYDNLIKYNADIVIGGTEKFTDETDEIIWTSASDKEEILEFSSEEAMKDFFKNGCASWARLYKMSIHKDILFPKGEINEDEAIVLSLLEKCKRVVKSNRVVYKYRYRPQSITSKRWSLKKLIWCDHCRNNLDYIYANHSKLIEVAQTRYISSIIWALNCMTVDIKEYKFEIKEYKKELKKYIMFYIKNKHKGITDKLRAILLLYFYTLYAYITNKLGKKYE